MLLDQGNNHKSRQQNNKKSQKYFHQVKTRITHNMWKNIWHIKLIPFLHKVLMKLHTNTDEFKFKKQMQTLIL